MPDRSEAEQLNAIAIPPAETLARQLLFRRTCFQQTSLVQKMTFLSSINPARAVTGRRCPHSALCAVRKVYFSAQPNNLKLILNFQKYYPIEHIFVPACSSVRKIHFFKF